MLDIFWAATSDVAIENGEVVKRHLRSSRIHTSYLAKPIDNHGAEKV